MQMGTPDSKGSLHERLQAIAQAFPELAQTARLYDAVLPVIRDEELPVLPSVPSQEEVIAKLEQGIPCLENMDLDADSRRVSDLLLRLAATAEKAGSRINAEKLGEWLEKEHAGDVSAAFQAIAAGDKGQAGVSLEQMDMDSGLCGFLAQTSLKPLLRAWRLQVAPLTTMVKWGKGTCFVCGSDPVFAELRGNAQERHLRCGLCGAGWRYPRLQCAFCGNTDHATQRVLYREGAHLSAFVEACNQCKCYLKVLPAFAAVAPDMLAIEDLATFYLDDAAVKGGYRRPEFTMS